MLVLPSCRQELEPPPAVLQTREAEGARLKRPRHAALEIPEDGGVTLTGALEWQGKHTGVVQLDIVTLVEGRPPELIHQASLGLADKSDGSAFQVELLADIGEVHLVAYIDQNSNGPSPGELTATQVIHVGGSAISGLTLSLEADTDLGRLAPGAPPPANAGPPPEDNSGIVEGSTQAAAER